MGLWGSPPPLYPSGYKNAVSFQGLMIYYCIHHLIAQLTSCVRT
jgi:hypothetical protein